MWLLLLLSHHFVPSEDLKICITGHFPVGGEMLFCRRESEMDRPQEPDKYRYIAADETRANDDYFECQADG